MLKDTGEGDSRPGEVMYRLKKYKRDNFIANITKVICIAYESPLS
jgi:hypothetical protein